ncbi:MAG TPA: guanylate kinase [Burkholderiales bacterium]
MPTSLTNARSGNLFVVAAPSGAGKSTLVNALLAKDDAIILSISYTTRPARPGEENGRQYHFVSLTEFAELRERGDFLEWAEVHGNFYGTSRNWIEGKLQLGKDILLEIDWQGAQQIRQQFPDAVGIFILPPSIAALESRLRTRGQDDSSVITQRLLAAGGEMAHASEFQYVIINQDFALALEEMSAIVTASRLRFPAQFARHANLFVQLGIR